MRRGRLRASASDAKEYLVRLDTSEGCMTNGQYVTSWDVLPVELNQLDLDASQPILSVFTHFTHKNVAFAL